VRIRIRRDQFTRQHAGGGQNKPSPRAGLSGLAKEWGIVDDGRGAGAPQTKHTPDGHYGVEGTYLALDISPFIVAVGSGTQRSAGSVSASNATALCEVLLALGLSDLDLLFLAAAAELVRLESALRLEGRATVLGDIAFGHGGEDCGCSVWGRLERCCRLGCGHRVCCGEKGKLWRVVG
jgi:hypothetical protein